MPTFDMGTFQPTQNASKNPSEQNFEGYRMNVLKEFIKLKPPAFEGESDPLAAETWLKMVKTMFDTMGVLKQYWVEFATYLFEGSAEEWWDSKGDAFDIENLNWEEFETLFRETYVPETLRQDMIAELGRLVQRNMTVAEYHACFIKLSTYDPLMVADSVSRCIKFRKGLKSNIRDRLEPFTFTNFNELVDAAQKVESYLEQKNTLQDKVTTKSSRKTRNDSCFLCGQLGHKILTCPSRPSKSSHAVEGDQSGSKDSGTFFTDTICYSCGQEGHIKRTCPLNQSPSTPSVMEPLRGQPSSSVGAQLQGQSSPNDSGICHKCGQIGHVRHNCPLKQSPSTLSVVEPLRDPSSPVGEQLQGQFGSNDSGSAHSRTHLCHKCGQLGHRRRNCPLKQLPSTPSVVEPSRDPSSPVGGQLQGQSGSNDSGSAHSRTHLCRKCGQLGHRRRNCPLIQLPSTVSAVEPLRDPPSSSAGGQLQGQVGAKDSISVHSQARICHECGQVGHVRRNCPLKQSLSTLSAVEPLRDPSSSSVGGQLQGQSGAKDSSSVHSQAHICHECGQVGHLRHNCPLKQSVSTLSAMEPLRDPSCSSVGGQLQGQAKDSSSLHSQAYICHECGEVGHIRRNCPLIQSLSTRDPSSFSVGGQLQGQSGAKDSGGVHSQDYICHECGEVGHIRPNCPLKQSLDSGSLHSQAYICHECGKVGHIRPNCPLKQSLDSGGLHSQAYICHECGEVGHIRPNCPLKQSLDSCSLHSQAYVCHECGEVGHIRRDCPLKQSLSTRDPSSFSVGGQLQGQSGAKDSSSVHSQAYICHECGEVGHIRPNCPLKRSLSTRDPSSFSFGGQLQGQSSAKDSDVHSQACICYECGQVGHVRRTCPRKELTSTLSAAGPLRKKSSSSASGSERFMPYPCRAFAQIGHEMSRRQAKKLQQHSQHNVRKKLKA